MHSNKQTTLLNYSYISDGRLLGRVDLVRLRRGFRRVPVVLSFHEGLVWGRSFTHLYEVGEDRLGKRIGW